MIRQSSAALALFLSLISCGCGRDEDRPPPPRQAADAVNVLLISVDTLRADHLNCYGYRERTVSLNVDALARDGILFDNVISASPWTTPAHMSLITSLYPSSHGVIEAFTDLRKEIDSGGGFNRLPDARQTLAEILRGAGLATAAFTAGGTLDPRIGFGQGFDEYHVSMYKLRARNMEPMLQWIDVHREAPFFLFWHTFEIHAPYIRPTFLPDVLPAQTARAIGDELRQMAARLGERHAEIAERLVNVRTLEELLKRHDAFTLPVTEALYDGGVKHVDEWLGRVIAQLKAAGIYDRTLIIFTSDHGEEFAERSPDHIYNCHGHTTYREIIHVPLIIKLPHQQHAGTHVSSIARTVDVMPTVLDVLNVNADVPEMEGASLRPLWEDDTDKSSRVAFTEGSAKSYEVKSVRAGRYKYMVLIPSDIVESHGRSYLPPTIDARGLFDLVADPGERRNLLDAPGAVPPPGIASSLDRRLREFVDMSQGVAEHVELDEGTLNELRALGYVN